MPLAVTTDRRTLQFGITRGLQLVSLGERSTDDHGDRTAGNLHSEQRSLPPQRQDTNLKVGSNAGSFIVSSRRVGPGGPSRRSDDVLHQRVSVGECESVQCAVAVTTDRLTLQFGVTRGLQLVSKGF